MKYSAALLSTLVASSCLAIAGPHEEKVSIDKIPVKAAEALRKQAAGAEIQKIEKETEDGETVYEAKFQHNGRVQEVSVDENGVVVSEEEILGLAEAPEKVQKAIHEQAMDGKVEKVERTKEKGKTTYEVKIVFKDMKAVIVLDDEGKILKTERKSHDSEQD